MPPLKRRSNKVRMPVHSLLVMLTFLMLTCTGALAQGSYSATFTGGSAVSNPGNSITPYSGSSAPALGDASTCTGGTYSRLTTSSTGQQMSGGVTCSGAITATFTWNSGRGNPPPPTMIIIEEQESASWGMSGNAVSPTGSATCDITPSVTNGDTQTATKYSFMSNPGASFTLSRSPTASVSATSPTTPNGICSGSASVSYSVTIWSVGIGITPTTVDSSQTPAVLIGQTVSVSVNAGPFTPTSWQWTVPDSSSAYQTWQPTTPAVGNTPANPNASYLVSGPGPLTNATASWFWDISGSAGSSTPETIQCAVSGTFPDGTTGSATPTLKVNVYIPNWTMTATPGQTAVWYGSIGGQSPGFYLIAYGTSNTVSHGITWNGSVTAPSNTTFGNGIIAVAQLISQNVSITIPVAGGGSQVYVESPQTQGLDGDFPIVSGQQITNQGDSPSQPLSGPPALLAASIDSQMVDYVMYEPPNTTQYVPVSTAVNWSPNVSTIEPEGGWAQTVLGTPLINGSFTPGNTFPNWTQIITPGNFIPSGS